MKLIKSIPSIWLRAYLFMCCWFFFNLGISEWSTYIVDDEIGTLIGGAIAILFSCLYSIFIWLWSNYWFRKKNSIQVIAHVIGLLATYATYGLLTYFINIGINNITLEKYFTYLYQELTWLFFTSNSFYVSAVIVFYIICYIQSIQEKEKEKNRLELVNQQMQLSLLKSQLNPHFLFNTLNTLSSLIYSEKEKARAVLNRFSDILRYSLDSDKEKLVPIRKELAFINDYLFIQKMRFEDRLTISRNIDDDCLETLIPPMVLQPLVENAMIHGISKLEEGGTIEIVVNKVGENVFLVIENSPSSSTHKKTENGMGLRNCNERLKVMYGENSALKIDSNINGYKVRFSIPT